MIFTREKVPIIASGMFLILVTACAERASEDSAATTNVVPPEIENSEMALGKRVFASCASCHTINAGGARTIGPNLSGVLGSTAGSKSDYAYSESLSKSGIVWTEETLDDYIESPATYVPGGTMAYAGVADENDRTAVISYLIAKTSNDNVDHSLRPQQQM